jgi:hypothetical protein
VRNRRNDRRTSKWQQRLAGMARRRWFDILAREPIAERLYKRLTSSQGSVILGLVEMRPKGPGGL